MTPLDWMMGEDTGISSNTILHVMEGTRGPARVSVPLDVSDFERCHKLLEAFPLYRTRLYEVADKYPAWTGLVREWNVLTDMYLRAMNSGRKTAPQLYQQLYQRMSDLIDEGRRADGWTETTPGYWTRVERPGRLGQ